MKKTDKNVGTSAEPMRVAIYARVSTSHHNQSTDAQIFELREYCSRRGWFVTEEIIDHGYSGGTDNRPGLKRLMELVRQRKVDCVAVTKLDRLFRSLKHLVNVLDEFKSVGVLFISVCDSIDFSSPSGRLLFGVLASLSEFEKDLILERTMAGLEAARRKGKVLGRPKHNLDEQIVALHREGKSYRRIASLLGVSRASVYRAVKAAQKPPQSVGVEATQDQGVSDE